LTGRPLFQKKRASITVKKKKAIQGWKGKITAGKAGRIWQCLTCEKKGKKKPTRKEEDLNRPGERKFRNACMRCPQCLAATGRKKRGHSVNEKKNIYYRKANDLETKPYPNAGKISNSSYPSLRGSENQRERERKKLHSKEKGAWVDLKSSAWNPLGGNFRYGAQNRQGAAPKPRKCSVFKKEKKEKGSKMN